MTTPTIVAAHREITESLGQISGLLVDGNTVQNVIAELLAYVIDEMDQDGVYEIDYTSYADGCDLEERTAIVSGETGERPVWAAAMKLAAAVLEDRVPDGASTSEVPVESSPIAEELECLRVESGRTLQDVAATIGVESAVLAAWETGTAEPTLSQMEI